MYLAVAEWDHQIRKTPAGPLRGVRIYYMFPTLKHFTRLGHAEKMLDELNPKGTWGFLGGEINRSEWTIRFPGGSKIQVVSAEVSNRGARADIAVLDEADEIDISKYEAEVGPWFTEPWSLKKTLITGTPKRGRFGLLWRAYWTWPNGDADIPALPGHFGFHATVFDADPSVVDHSEAEGAKKRINPVRFETEYLCNFDSAEGLVYPFFNVAFHVRQPLGLGAFHTFIVGVDHGFNDPTVFLVIGLAGSGKDMICHVLREHYMLEKSASELAEVAKTVERDFPGAKWYADHDLAKNKELHDEARVNIVTAEKGPGSVESGVAVVGDALYVRTILGDKPEDDREFAQLYVSPECVHTIDEFGKYRRKRDSRDIDRVLDTIDSSKDDHCMDALRYALYSHFIGPEKRLVRTQKLR